MFYMQHKISHILSRQLVQNLQKKCRELESEIKQLSEKNQLCEENNGKMLQSVMNLERDLYKNTARRMWTGF